MARSDEAEWWFNAVYSAVQEIPLGQVTSYGHIARLLGRRKIFDYLQLSPP
jgi:methylated-DNA-protein-cysteine methyltransferase-like protein